MVRNCQRKTTRANYSQAKLHDALEEIKSGKSLKATSAKFKISRKTLRRHRYGKVLQPGVPCLGRYKRALPEDAELAIADCIKDMQKRMFGLTCKDVRKIAFSFADRQNINHPFNKETKMAGKEWMHSFMNRHDLSIRTPQSTSLARVVGFNKPKVDEFFTVLAEIMTKYTFLFGT